MMRRFKRSSIESARNSDDNFCVIPGIEFAVTRHMHIVGLGVTRLIPPNDPRNRSSRDTSTRRICDPGPSYANRVAMCRGCAAGHRRGGDLECRL